MSIKWTDRATSPAEVVAYVKSNHCVFVHGACATPTTLTNALALRRDVENVRLYHMHTAGPAAWISPALEGLFRSVSLFTGGPLRIGPYIHYLKGKYGELYNL